MIDDLFDTAKLPASEPDEIYSGNLVRWRRTDLSNDWDVSSYSLTYSARREASDASKEIEITATSDATGWYVDESYTTTELWEPGVYHWQAYITRNSDSERIVVDSGRWTVLVNLDADVRIDPRTHAAKMVDLLESVLENRAGNDIIYYMIGGRAVSKIPLSELRKLLVDYRQEARSEEDSVRRERGLPTKNSVTVRFV